MTSTTLPLPTSATASISDPDPQLLCFRCANPLAPLRSTSSQTCSLCLQTTVLQAGIWKAFSPDHAATYDRFIAEYECIRHAEGRGSSDPAYYQALPFKDLTRKLKPQWKIRARTFRHLARHVLPGSPARILDLGAGNGWLSYRLALLGHHPVAVDLLTNPTDGLRAASHFAPVTFPRVQASLDHLPFADRAFDLAIFNASLHYSENLLTTTAEALRTLRPGGSLVIADTPWYAEQAQGQRMVQEKHATFRSTFGFASNSLNHQEFLTPERLAQLARALNLTWRVHKPFYGLRWALRPLRARLAGRRTPSHFRIFVASRQP